ncbi:glycosyltransferase family 2 protein [Shimia sp. SDUM112013]|uniref:glycosyltransferase family 2 protein n=1 Tax=Shimia sp. SDUM112013 TaxID=3136160 RepID=UPI0032EB2609
MNNPGSKFQLSEASVSFLRPASLVHTLQNDFGVSARALLQARQKLSEWDANLGEILCAEGALSEADYLLACAQVDGYEIQNLHKTTPDPDLHSRLPPAFCLKHNVLPIRKEGDKLVFVTGRPERIPFLRKEFPSLFASAKFDLAPEAEVTEILGQVHRSALVNLAETRPDEHHSCRPSAAHRASRVFILSALFLLFSAAVLAPAAMLVVLLAWVLLAQCATFAMKLGATVARLGMWRSYEIAPPSRPLPRISVMVPLFREHDIAGALVRRLSRLTYPKPLLDVLLVLEEHDEVTRKTIEYTTLPSWIRVVVVPAGDGLTTKPRALNYALDFCRGDLIGIWDAEDAPAPDQLEKVARHFDRAPSEMACVQGVLDYYNPYTNWLSRCFTIEYATWFRIILPGLARLGFSIPLGGTTLFLRRDVIEEVGGWDAHNVTEDADLGVRLARFGYRTELLPCVTQEEANCRPVAWIKQRSRWLKGYMITYLVHMRQPWRLLREIGLRKVLGLQLIFAATLSQFLLAPLLWLFWGNALGLDYFRIGALTDRTILTIGGVLTLFGICNAAISLWAVSGQDRARLYPWVLTMVFYFPLATFAAYKALYELLTAPYFWDKTAHGKTSEGLDAQHSGVGVLFKPSDKCL